MSYLDLPRVEKLWGAEYWLVNTPRYCCKVLEMRSGARGSLHYHVEKDETFLVVEGRVRLEIVEDRVHRFHELGLGDFLRIPPLTAHRFEALTERALVVESSTHHEDGDTRRLEASELVGA